MGIGIQQDQNYRALLEICASIHALMHESVTEIVKIYKYLIHESVINKESIAYQCIRVCKRQN